MRKVELNMKEEKKYEVIKDIVNNKCSKKSASIKLGLSIRHINRLINSYKIYGKKAFKHKNRDKVSKKKISDDIKGIVINYYNEICSNANYSHFKELLMKYKNINLSITSIRNILMNEFIVSPKANKSTKRKINKILKEMKNKKNVSKKQHNTICELESRLETLPHPKREKHKNMGEQIQMDSSMFEFIKGKKLHLHLAVDDASNTIVGAYLDIQETLKGYLNVTKQILINYGIPYGFYTDNRTVFKYEFVDDKKEINSLTKFEYICNELGIELKTTSVPQSKGLIERMNQTFQDRLTTELKVHNIQNIDEANIFLKNVFLPEHNNKFAHRLNSTRNVFVSQDWDEKEVDRLLSIYFNRIIQNNHSIRFNNKYYFPIDENSEKIYFKKKTKAMVIKTLSDELFVNIEDKIYILQEIPKHELYSKVFDDIEEKKKEEKKKYIPPLNHPWRIQNYNDFLEKKIPGKYL